MSEILRVLQVEDSESDAALIIRLLERSGHKVYSERVEDAASMRRALAREEWDVVIADYQLPQFNAGEALKIRNEFAREIPLLVVSGTIGEDLAAELVRAGAQDYVLKDRISRLAPAVEREIREARLRGERRKVDDRLRDRDAWLALAVEATQLGMFDFHPQTGRLVLTESGHCHFGLPAGPEVSYKSLERAVHPDDRERVESLVRKALDHASGDEFRAEFRTIGLEDQIERWLAAQGRVFFDADGRPIRFVGVTQDVTSRKQVEQRLIILDRAKSDFLTLISHEFRTPLNGILGVGDLILDGMPATERNKALRGVFEAGRRRILSILDDALLLTLIDVNAAQFKTSLVSLHKALISGVERANEFAESRGVTIMPPPAVDVLVLANEELLIRALRALFETAVKFSEREETVVLSHSRAGNSPSIVIESFGRTIPEPSQATFFDILAISEAMTPGGDLGLAPAVASRTLLLFGAAVSVANRHPSGIRLTVSLKDAGPSVGATR